MRAETNSMLHGGDQLAMIRSFLEKDYSDVPKKYQNPKLLKRTDVPVPFYYLRARLRKGEPRRILKLGFCHEMTVKAAMQARADALSAVNAGLLVVQAHRKFRELVERFESIRLPEFGAGTQGRYTSQIHKHILPAFGDRRLADIDTALIEGWLNGKQRDGLSWWSREGLRGVMSSIFCAAKEWKLWSGENPASNVRLGKKKEARELSKKEPITAVQLQLILGAVTETTRLILLIAALLGLRISEILGVRWSDLDLEAGTLTINRRWYRGDVAEPKNATSQRKMAVGPLLEAFAQRFPGAHRREEYVFRGEDGPEPLDEREILRWELRPALKRLKLHYPGFGWHQFRRLSITIRQTVGGATTLEACKGAGQSRVSTTLHYTLIDIDRQGEQVQRMYDWAMGAPQGPKQ